MKYKDNQFIKANDLSFIGVLRDIKESRSALQPVFECFTNALESAKIKQDSNVDYKGKISIKIYTTKTLLENTEFHHLSITDNGIGFNDKEFDRFNTYKQVDKGFNNLGSGRIQYVHYFDLTTIKSVFEQDGKFFERRFDVSKKKDFISKNAIVKRIYCKEVDVSDTETTVSFNDLLRSRSSVYNVLDAQTLKEKLIDRYVHYFCYNKDILPEISIEFYISSKLKNRSVITRDDIPSIDKTCHATVQYSKKGNKGFDKVKKSEDFTIDAFKISKKRLKENKLNLVSKGEIIEESNVTFESLAKGEMIEDSRFLFLVSSDYIDERDTNARGVLNIPTMVHLQMTCLPVKKKCS